MTIQRPVGIWASSPARRMLWAVGQLRMELERAEPEQPLIDTWEELLDQAITAPVDAYDWAALYRKTDAGVAKADQPDVPEEVVSAWEIVFTVEQVGEGLVGRLWQEAATTRAASLQLPFAAADLEAGIQEAFGQVNGIPDTMRTELRTLMRETYDLREGQFEFARRIRSEWAGLSVAKARQIAVTEWNRAASTATLAGYRKQGVERKVWFTAGDSRICPVCEENAAAGEIGINKPFPTGVDCPPGHPSCRCNVSSA